jgi:hypothetical protein
MHALPLNLCRPSSRECRTATGTLRGHGERLDYKRWLKERPIPIPKLVMQLHLSTMTLSSTKLLVAGLAAIGAHASGTGRHCSATSMLDPRVSLSYKEVRFFWSRNHLRLGMLVDWNSRPGFARPRQESSHTAAMSTSQPTPRRAVRTTSTPFSGFSKRERTHTERLCLCGSRAARVLRLLRPRWGRMVPASSPATRSTRC